MHFLAQSSLLRLVEINDQLIVIFFDS